MTSRTLLALVVTFVVATVSPHTHADDRRPSPDTLSVMAINGEFLWDGLQPEEGSSDIEFPWKGSPEKAAAHMADIAALIRQGNADIVNLVEIENLQALELLNDRHLEGMGYVPYFVQGADTFTGQDVALLTRVDPEGDQIHREDRPGRLGGTTKTVSKNLYATFDVGGRRIAVIGLHFLARPDDHSRLEPRQAQADAILQRALDLDRQGYEVIVLGDFNDFDGHPRALEPVMHSVFACVVSGYGKEALPQ